MNTKSLLLPLVTLVLAGGYSVRQDQENQDLTAKLAEVETRLTSIETYLQAQAAGAQAYSAAVDRAVEDGYTWGENNNARKVLVEAWKAHAKAVGTNVPGAKSEKAAPRVDPRIARRQRNK
ncbi:MAG: hypothetical protein V3T22_00910 [Planctomycetota bacterium]